MAMPKSKRFKKRFIIIPIILIIAVIIFLKVKPKNEQDENLPPLTVIKEVSGNNIPISGYISAARTQLLESPGEGLVEYVPVKEGQTVKKGDIIFKLDDSEERYNLANQEFTMRQEEINASPRKLALLKEQYNMLKKRLDDRTVRAKFDGVIASLKVSEGEYAMPKNSFGAIVDRSYLKATVEVNEMDSANLQVNQKVMLNFPSQQNLVVEGYVVSYPALARVTDIGRTVVDTLIQVDNPPDEILPGYSFDGSIIVGESSEVLILETGGVRYVEGVPVADKIVGDSTEEVQIEIEPYMQGFVKIISGLAEGDTVVNHGSMDMNQW
ncbi:MAG: efflux RND transporter periplasmic adaptor subunit [Treponemataceae bacterium]